MTAARSLFFALALVLSVSSGFAQTAPLGDPRTMTFEPVTITVPEVERVVLENGIIVYLLPDRELPLVSVSAMIRTGSIYEPADKVGLAGLTGIVMRTGGTARLAGDQVDEELEFLAANISMGIGAESGSASLDLLKKDLPQGLAIFADMLRTPAFEPAKVEQAKRQALDAIRRRPDSPGGIAAREFRSCSSAPIIHSAAKAPPTPCRASRGTTSWPFTGNSSRPTRSSSA